jgi:hypothetical protein
VGRPVHQVERRARQVGGVPAAEGQGASRCRPTRTHRATAAGSTASGRAWASTSAAAARPRRTASTSPSASRSAAQGRRPARPARGVPLAGLVLGGQGPVARVGGDQRGDGLAQCARSSESASSMVSSGLRPRPDVRVVVGWRGPARPRLQCRHRSGASGHGHPGQCPAGPGQDPAPARSPAHRAPARVSAAALRAIPRPSPAVTDRCPVPRPVQRQQPRRPSPRARRRVADSHESGVPCR